MKKVLSLVLVFALLLCTSTFALVASAYSEKTTLKLEVDKTQLNVGDTFKLKFTMPEIMTDIPGLAFYVKYDTSVVEMDYSTMVCEGFPSGWSNEGQVADGIVVYQLMDAYSVTSFTEENTSTAYVEITGTALAAGTTTFEYYAEDDYWDVNDPDWNPYDPSNLNPVTATVTVGGGDEPDPVPETWTVTLVNYDGTSKEVLVNDGETIPADELYTILPSTEYLYSWSEDVTAPITSEKTITLTRSEKTYEVSVNGVVKNMKYKSALVVTADAEKDGKAFSHWTKDGKVVSYEKTYKLLVYADTTIEAVYDDSAAVASAFIDTPYYTMYTTSTGEKVKMVSSLQVVLPAGVKVSSFTIYRANREGGSQASASTLIASGTKVNAGSCKFNAQGRLDYSLLAALDATLLTDVVFTATLSDGTVVTSNVVTVGASLR